MGAIVAGGAIAAAGAIGGALISSNAAGKAANTQAGAAEYAAQLQYKEFQQQQQQQAPWIAAGTKALSTLEKGSQPGGQFNKPFTMQDFHQDPGYNFQKQQMTGSVNAAAAASGVKFSPTTMAALAQYTGGLANQDYQTAYGNYMQKEQLALNEQQSLAGAGQSATNTIGQLGSQAMTNIGNDYMQAANARAAGTVGTANAINGGLSSAGNSFMNAYMMKSLFGTPGTTTPTTTVPNSVAQGTAFSDYATQQPYTMDSAIDTPVASPAIDYSTLA